VSVDTAVVEPVEAVDIVAAVADKVRLAPLSCRQEHIDFEPAADIARPHSCCPVLSVVG